MDITVCTHLRPAGLWKWSFKIWQGEASSQVKDVLWLIVIYFAKHKRHQDAMISIFSDLQYFEKNVSQNLTSGQRHYQKFTPIVQLASSPNITRAPSQVTLFF